MSHDADGNTDESETEGERAAAADEELTYAEAGVDVAASEAATAALVGAAGEASGDIGADGGTDGSGGDYAGLLDLGGQYLGLATDGVGTKLLVAAALGEYSTIGIDCVAMNANDLVAAGVEPVAFVDYLAVAEPDDGVATQVGEGLAAGAERAGVALVGGETAVMPEVIKGVDLAGTCAGFAAEQELFPDGAEPGDALVGFPSSGIHSNGLTLAREAATRGHDSPAAAYAAPFPGAAFETVGEALLEPTRIYADLLDPLREHGAHAAAHVTGGGWRNLARMGPLRYAIDDPLPAGPVFAFVQREGNVADREMHRTFNMGTGFVAALPPADAETLADATDGEVIGRVEDGTNAGGVVAIRGLELD
jgi:phosphoribosylformylglycinamidine cyclo-ligase